MTVEIFEINCFGTDLERHAQAVTRAFLRPAQFTLIGVRSDVLPDHFFVSPEAAGGHDSGAAAKRDFVTAVRAVQTAYAVVFNHQPKSFDAVQVTPTQF